MTTRAIQIESLLDPVIDGSTGAVASGYTVYFYAAGTTTAKNVWTEKEKTNPFTSKTLGSDGTFQLYGDGVYKIVIKDGDGDTVHEWDNIKIQANNFSVVQKSATYTGTPDDDVILVDTDGGNITINLQTVANFTYPVVVKNIGSNQVTIDPYSTETIDGASTVTLSSNAHVTLYPDTESNIWRRTVGVTVLEDADGDTKVQVEESSDEDIIRFDLGNATLTSAAEIMTLQAIDTTTCKLEPTTDDKLDLGSSTKKFRNAYIDGVAFVDEYNITGAYDASMPTNGVSADAKFMLGNSNTIAWFYLNVAPPGWKALSTGGDTVLAVAGGSGDYNVDGGNPDAAASWSIDGLTNANESAHTHSGTNGDSTSSVDLGAYLTIDSGVLRVLNSGGSGNYDKATGNVGAGTAHTHTISSDASYRPSASVGKLFQLDTA